MVGAEDAVRELFELDFLLPNANAAPAPAPTTAARIIHFLWLPPLKCSCVGPWVMVTIGTTGSCATEAVSGVAAGDRSCPGCAVSRSGLLCSGITGLGEAVATECGISSGGTLFSNSIPA